MASSETVLVIGATGNIGVSAIIGALANGLNVLAVVRNDQSAEKMFREVGTRKRITTVEANVLSEDGVQSVVDKVRDGSLPAIQHVYCCVGGMVPVYPLQSIDTEAFRKSMEINHTANFFAYRATVPYLLEQDHPNSTYTQCTGGSADSGLVGLTGMAEGAVASMMNAAILENQHTNIRVYEVNLVYGVNFDSVHEKQGGYQGLSSTEFSRIYQQILATPEISGCRVSVNGPQDVEELQFTKKISHGYTNEELVGTRIVA